jgi:hypothetical protein
MSTEEVDLTMFILFVSFGQYLRLELRALSYLNHALSSDLVFFFFFLVVLGFDLRALYSRQALYRLSHPLEPFLLGYFGEKVSLFAQARLD